MAIVKLETTGRSALRAAYHSTLRVGRPLARATRTKSSSMVVIIWLRIARMKPAVEARTTVAAGRSGEDTAELPSQSKIVCRLFLLKKKKKKKDINDCISSNITAYTPH